LTSLYEQVPKDVLPTDYGGKAGSLAEHCGETKDNLKSEIIIFTAGSFQCVQKMHHRAY